MKYNPEYNPFRDFEYESKEQLGKHLDLVKYNPDKNRFICTLCGKELTTYLGAHNHLDFTHTAEVLDRIRK